MKTVQKVAAAAMKAFNADGITLLQASEVASGQVVFHLHFHIMPRWEGKSLGPAASKMEKPEVLEVNAERIRKAIAA
jgi:histidine triad (HIT) family protein